LSVAESSAEDGEFVWHSNRQGDEDGIGTKGLDMHWLWIGFMLAVGIAILRALVGLACSLLEVLADW